ncbi:hypothetical protein LCGC14_1767420 [marine sediment metagenome]|uniref:Uncharacterized protein n=1 Tax=marine sediment metagenome TaxID=412755 RepID=A0A0F9HLS2_9ZZZZ
MEIREEIAKLNITMPADMPQNLVGTDLADKILKVLKNHGVRAGYAHVVGESWPGIKAYASDGHAPGFSEI